MHVNHLLRELLEHREKPQVTFISLSFTHSFIEIHIHTHTQIHTHTHIYIGMYIGGSVMYQILF